MSKYAESTRMRGQGGNFFVAFLGISIPRSTKEWLLKQAILKCWGILWNSFILSFKVASLLLN